MSAATDQALASLRQRQSTDEQSDYYRSMASPYATGSPQYGSPAGGMPRQGFGYEEYANRALNASAWDGTKNKFISGPLAGKNRGEADNWLRDDSAKKTPEDRAQYEVRVHMENDRSNSELRNRGRQYDDNGNLISPFSDGEGPLMSKMNQAGSASSSTASPAYDKTNPQAGWNPRSLADSTVGGESEDRGDGRIHYTAGASDNRNHGGTHQGDANTDANRARADVQMTYKPGEGPSLADRSLQYSNSKVVGYGGVDPEPIVGGSVNGVGAEQFQANRRQSMAGGPMTNTPPTVGTPPDQVGDYANRPLADSPRPYAQESGADRASRMEKEEAMRGSSSSQSIAAPSIPTAPAIAPPVTRAAQLRQSQEQASADRNAASRPLAPTPPSPMGSINDNILGETEDQKKKRLAAQQPLDFSKAGTMNPISTGSNPLGGMDQTQLTNSTAAPRWDTAGSMSDNALGAGSARKANGQPLTPVPQKNTQPTTYVAPISAKPGV